ncbi:hypothetical protein DPMN_174221 [Dreissena polymorpha]|uniref:Secreted protein n=1 Tax=Dreissena polymorpha TaxID=45954 RepID=A0A9D4E612_DREPO|nr:hypothetical protein DPMN_174221 [Dreissena polymorpha]
MPSLFITVCILVLSGGFIRNSDCAPIEAHADAIQAIPKLNDGVDIVNNADITRQKRGDCPLCDTNAKDKYIGVLP